MTDEEKEKVMDSIYSTFAFRLDEWLDRKEIAKAVKKAFDVEDAFLRIRLENGSLQCKFVEGVKEEASYD